MNGKTLQTALLGITDKGLELLDAAIETGLFHIQAVADRRPEIVEKTARRLDCVGFDDYRQLIVQNQLDVLFVAAPVHICREHILAAMKKKFNIIKIKPPANNFEQTVEFIQTAEKENIIFFVTNPSRFAPGFIALNDYLASEQNLEKCRLIAAACNLPGNMPEPDNRWLADPKLAGGGVLLRDCYEIVHQIVHNFGIPQQVYSLNTNHAPDKQQRLSITEDTVVAAMKFSDILAASFIASRTFGPPIRRLTLHYPESYLLVEDNYMAQCDHLGNVIHEEKYDHDPKNIIKKMLESFADTMLSVEKKPSPVDENPDLRNMALIEATYLSARTAMPEEPARILNMAGA